MAINKVAQFGSTLEGQSDYQAQNSHINAFIQQMMGEQLHLTEWATTTVPAIAQGVYIAHGGTLYLVETSDASISTGDLSGSGDYYIRLSVSGDTLVADWESSLSGYAWNHVYNGYYSGTTQLLPYVVAFNGSAYVKYKYDFQRGVLQSIGMADSPTFGGLTLNGSLLLRAGTNGTQTVSTSGGTWVIPRGVYSIAQTGAVNTGVLQKYNGSSWVDYGSAYDKVVISDGSDTRVLNSSGTYTAYIEYRKY